MRPYRLTALAPSEHDLQGSILVYLAWDNRVAWAHRFNTGAHVITGIDAQGQPHPPLRALRFPGCADILGQLVTGHFLAIEVKRPGGRVGPAQRRFLAQVRAAGGLALLARGIPEVQAGLDHFLGGRAAWVGSYPLPPVPRSPRGRSPGAPQRPASRPCGRGGDKGSGDGR
jgi:hypothetical protein